MSKICRKEGLELKKNLPGYLLMAPAVIAVLALSVYPLFRGIYLSFLNYNLVRPNDPTFNTFAGLQNYIDIFKDKVFLQSIGNTVKWTVVNLVVQHASEPEMVFQVPVPSEPDPYCGKSAVPDNKRMKK